MTDRKYWIDLFTAVTWKEFHAAGSKVSGFRKSRLATCKKIKPGDYFLCYITGISRFAGILEVTSYVFEDNTEIWMDDDFPIRFGVKLIAKLDFINSIPVMLLREDLSFFQNMKSPHAWTGKFRGSPSLLNKDDGKIIINAIIKAKQNPTDRPFDEKKLKYRPRGIEQKKLGTVTIPETEVEEQNKINDIKPQTKHTEIQALLLQLGSEMGFDLWVARNDRSRLANGKKLSDFPRMQTSLPLQFDEATNKTIELIDVLWLRGNSIVAAFEIESTTSIYSGLLRMSDLVAMQPNINIPLYIVAPDDRRLKVFSEVNRPTFTKLKPSLSLICKYISFSALEMQIEKASDFLRFLKPDFLDDLAESCEANNI